jgi:hypothetical protein
LGTPTAVTAGDQLRQAGKRLMKPKAELEQLLTSISHQLSHFPCNLGHTVLSYAVNSKQSSKPKQMASIRSVALCKTIHTKQTFGTRIPLPDQRPEVHNSKDHEHHARICTAAP